VLRQVLLAAQQDGIHVVGAIATGCMEVTTTIYPRTAWRIPMIHSAFENVAATLSGVETAYRALKKKGKVDKDIRFIAFGGDGGTYDIGLQSLSGALERGHRLVYVCYDNGAYMNTGIQRSGATPMGASTSTAPAGKVSAGKSQRRKDLTKIVEGHNIPYVAQASPHNFRDLMTKVQKAIRADGPAFLNILATCHRGWRCDMGEALDIAKMGVTCCYWPLFEIEKGKLKLNAKPRKRPTVREWMERQGRFKHLFTPKNEHLIEEIQREVDERWEELVAREERDQAKA
jgi:pyruvate ferredoxin oxidoreductase beta subunit